MGVDARPPSGSTSTEETPWTSRGKRQPGLHWQWIGESGVDYQLDAAWGTDVLHVGTALGVGGIAFLVNDTVSKPWTSTPSGAASSRAARSGASSVSITRVGRSGRKKTDVTSIFTIYAGERITEHRVTSELGGPPSARHRDRQARFDVPLLEPGSGHALERRRSVQGGGFAVARRRGARRPDRPAAGRVLRRTAGPGRPSGRAVADPDRGVLAGGLAKGSGRNRRPAACCRRSPARTLPPPVVRSTRVDPSRRRSGDLKGERR